MKIKYEDSIKDRVISAAKYAKENNLTIKHIELAESEYIQLLEEVSPITRVLIVDPISKIRSFAGVTLRIVP
jgi:hypothetical protein